MLDWQFIFGIGVAIVFFFFQFVVKIMPTQITWSGISIGVLFMIWGIFSAKYPNQRIPFGPAILFIIGFSYIVGSIAWFIMLKQSISTYDIEKVRRHRLRMDLTQYLSQGTFYRDWFLLFLQPAVEHGTGRPIDNSDNISKKIMEIQQWDTELTGYLSSRISGQSGTWFMSKTKSGQYPKEIGNNIILQHVWDTVTSNLSKIEQLLRELPELDGGVEETALMDKAEAADISTKKLIHWTQEPMDHTGNVYQIKVAIRATQDLDNPIFDVRCDSPITSARIQGNSDKPSPMTGKVHIPGGHTYHFEVLHKLIKDRPIIVIIASGQPIAVKDVLVRIW